MVDKVSGRDGVRWVGCPCGRGHGRALTAFLCAGRDSSKLRVQTIKGQFRTNAQWTEPSEPDGAYADELAGVTSCAGVRVETGPSKSSRERAWEADVFGPIGADEYIRTSEDKLAALLDAVRAEGASEMRERCARDALRECVPLAEVMKTLKRMLPCQRPDEECSLNHACDNCAVGDRVRALGDDT